MTAIKYVSCELPAGNKVVNALIMNECIYAACSLKLREQPHTCTRVHTARRSEWFTHGQ